MELIKNKIAIIVPCFNEQDCIIDFINAINNTVKENTVIKDYEIFFVDDGSSDSTLKIIQDVADKDFGSKIKYISFSRNFGKEAAIFAGLEMSSKYSDCDYFAVMDVDLQDPPNLLPEMLSYLIDHQDYSRIGTKRKDRKGEPAIRSFFANLFYKIMNRFSQVELISGARDYQLMNRKFAEAIISCKEYNRFYKGLSQWVGYKTYWMEFENIKRQKGKTKWSFWGLLKYSIEGIVAFSTVPLKLISIIGLVLSFVSFIALIFIFIRALTIGDPVAGWPSLICILLFLGGLILVSLGIIGIYLEKAYFEIKNRPIYLVDKENVSDAYTLTN